MIGADWIFLAVLLAVTLFGALVGLGKGLKVITGGIFGIIISILLCYLFGGAILAFPFVQSLLGKFASLWADSWFRVVHFEIILYYIILFIITCILRKLLVFVVKNIMESKNIVMKIINKVGGAILFVALAFLIMFFIFQIIAWIGGETEAEFLSSLAGSSILRPLYDSNPLATIVEMIRSK